MKTIRLILVLSLMIFISFGCEKSKDLTPQASLLVVQANPDVSSIIPVFGNETPTYFSKAVSIGYGGGQLYSLTSGSEAISVYQYPDTIKSFFNGSFKFDPVGIYSFFLAGNAARTDTLLIKEKITNYIDGSVGVRFINLSPDSQPLSINLDTNPGQAEFSNLSYKQASSFKVYQQNADGYYNFEVHDQASGDLLGTYSWYYMPNKNNTIVISGSVDPNSSTPLYIFQVNHFQ